MRIVTNLLKNPFYLGLPILSVFLLWGFFAYNAIHVYDVYFHKTNPDYPALIIGFMGLIIWLAVSFNDLNQSRLIDMTYNSPTSGRMGIPLSYVYILTK